MFRLRQLALALTLATSGCAASLSRAPLPDTFDSAEAEIARMEANPRPLKRPVIVLLSGFLDPNLLPSPMPEAFRKTSGDDRVEEMLFCLDFSFPSCRKKVIDRLEARWPSGNPDETVEVDVVSYCIGGLVARYAAVPAGTPGFSDRCKPEGKRLRIRTLYTAGTPHQGITLSWPMGSLSPDPRVRDMVPGSDFLAALDKIPMDYKMISYGVERDWVVGLEHCAPPGQEPRWTHWRPFHFSHIGTGSDLRILADILREMRKEEK